MKNRLFISTISRLGVLLIAALLISCGVGLTNPGDEGSERRSDELASTDAASLAPMVAVNLNVSIPTQLLELNIPLNVIVTVAGTTQRMNHIDDAYFLNLELPASANYPVYFAIARASDNLILESTRTDISTESEGRPFAIVPDAVVADVTEQS